MNLTSQPVVNAIAAIARPFTHYIVSVAFVAGVFVPSVGVDKLGLCVTILGVATVARSWDKAQATKAQAAIAASGADAPADQAAA